MSDFAKSLLAIFNKQCRYWGMMTMWSSRFVIQGESIYSVNITCRLGIYTIYSMSGTLSFLLDECYSCTYLSTPTKMKLLLSFRLGAEEIAQRLRMPLNYAPHGGEGPEIICDRVMAMIKKRLDSGDAKKSSMCESVAFKVR